jgi:hypothetical protein
MTTITTTLAHLVNAEPALARVAQLKLPVKVAYHLAKLVHLVQSETRLFYAQRTTFIKKLGVERDPTEDEAKRNGGQKITEVTADNLPEFLRRLDELGQVSVTLPWGPLDLEAVADLDIPASDLIELGPLVGLDSVTKEPPPTSV